MALNVGIGASFDIMSDWKGVQEKAEKLILRKLIQRLQKSISV
jgi:hypothetical protein